MIKFKVNTFYISFIGLFLTSGLFQQFGLRAQDENPKILEPGFLYIGEFISNMTGGIESGAAYLGLIDLSLSINLENVGIWKGGEFYFQLENTHGTTPSADLVGDFQVFSNIDNGNYTYLYEAWIKHNANNFSFQFGVIDLNADFLCSKYGGLFSNSSFGIMPAVSMNLPVPIFPKNALGLVLDYRLNDMLSIQTSFFDGDPSSLDEQANGFDLKVSKDEGMLSVTELHFSVFDSGATYKLGLAYNNGDFVQLVDSTQKKGNSVVYFIGDQELLPDRLNAFLKIGYGSKKYNFNQLFCGLGLNASIFENRENDVFGLAMGYAGISNLYYNEYKSEIKPYELAVEATYSFQVFDKLALQPYMQYIVNPGMKRDLDNAFIASLRLNVEF